MSIWDDLAIMKKEVESHETLSAEDRDFLMHAIAHGGSLAATHNPGDTYSYTYTEGGHTVTVTVGPDMPRSPTPFGRTSITYSGGGGGGRIGSIGVGTDGMATVRFGPTEPGGHTVDPGVGTVDPGVGIRPIVTDAAPATRPTSEALAAWHPAPAAGASPPPPPVPGSPDAAKAEGRKIGETFGEFLSWAESFLEMLRTPHGGVSIWDGMSQASRLQAIQKVQDVYNSLAKLKPNPDAALEAAQRQGFQEGAHHGYEASRVMARAIWISAELAKFAILAAASSPTPVAIEGFGADKFSDCAARTASRLFREMTGAEVPADFLVHTFGLPRTSIAGYGDAVAYSKAWFAGVGVKFADGTGGFRPLAEGGTQGHYAIFMRSLSGRGHVVYGEVAPGGLRIIDDQIGQAWTSLSDAQRALGMQATTVARVEELIVP